MERFWRTSKECFIYGLDIAGIHSLEEFNRLFKEFLRTLIMNYGYDSINCFTLILCGEPHLNATLRKPVHEALRQRITVHYNYKGLTDKETISYILHKLCTAGSSKAVIEDAALSAVAGHAHGNPRLIDNIMSDAVVIGAQSSKKCIDTETILAAVGNQNLD